MHSSLLIGRSLGGVGLSVVTGKVLGIEPDSFFALVYVLRICSACTCTCHVRRSHTYSRNVPLQLHSVQYRTSSLEEHGVHSSRRPHHTARQAKQV